MKAKPVLPIPALCLVTDRRFCQDVTLAEKVDQAVSGGVNLVQLREKDLPVSVLVEIALLLRKITQGRALLIINSSVRTALACNADGLHLEELGPSESKVRPVIGDDTLLGRSVHSLAKATEAWNQGADYLIVGTIFQTSSKPGVDPAGPTLLRDVSQVVPLPLLAIGGIKPDNTSQVIQAGASGVAAISALLDTPNPRQAAQRMAAALAEAWHRYHP